MNPRRIGVVTAGRSDFGIYRPVLSAICAHEALELVLIATGTHMDLAFGETVREIEQAGFTVDYRVPVVPQHDNAAAVAVAMGSGLRDMASVYADAELDMVLVLGDRFEMFAAAAAAVPFSLPLVHLHGGEVTEGAMDEQFRHAISKLSHVHFVSTERYRQRLLQMGELPERVVVSGAPGLDHLEGFEPWPRAMLEESLGIPLDRAPILVTFHPVTLHAEEQVDELLAALEEFTEYPIVITYPNSDQGHTAIIEKMEAFATSHSLVSLSRSLGMERYFSLMHYAAMMAGNSSSGIIEAASFGLPVVNIGDRQKGRERGANVLDVPCDVAAICEAMRVALSGGFKASLEGQLNPYGSGGAAEIIVSELAALPLGPTLIRKPFMDREFICAV